MKGKLEIQVKSPSVNTPLRNLMLSSRGLESRSGKLPDTVKKDSSYNFSRTKSHAEIMRVSMRTFLTDLNIPFTPQHPEVTPTDESESQQKKKEPRSKLSKLYTKDVSEFPAFVSRIDRTMSKLNNLKDKIQKSFASTTVSSPSVRPQTSVAFPSNNVLTAPLLKVNIKGRMSPDYTEKDFVNPDANETLMDIIRSIDNNQKTNAVTQAMWEGLSEGHQMFNRLKFERKKSEKEVLALREQLRALTIKNSNADLQGKIVRLKEEIETEEAQILQDDMRLEILDSMHESRKYQADLLKQRYIKKHGPLPKLENGLKATIDNIKKDTVAIENAMNGVEAIYTNLKEFQKVTKKREEDIQTQMQNNLVAEQNIAIEQDFKEQREDYMKRKRREADKALRKQEVEQNEKIKQEIVECEDIIAGYKADLGIIMKSTKHCEEKSDVLNFWSTLLDTQETFRTKLSETEDHQHQIEARLQEEEIELKSILTIKVTKKEVNSIPELTRRQLITEKAQRDLDKDKGELMKNQRIVAGYISGLTKLLDEIGKRKYELGLDDIELITCTEDNLEQVMSQLSEIVEHIMITQRDDKQTGLLFSQRIVTSLQGSHIFVENS